MSFSAVHRCVWLDVERQCRGDRDNTNWWTPEDRLAEELRSLLRLSELMNTINVS